MIPDNTSLGRQSLFEERRKRFTEETAVLQKKSDSISAFRILFFVAGVTALVYFANDGNLTLVLALIFVFPILFGFFINFHNKVKYQLNQNKFLAEINEREILRISLKLQSLDGGSEFIDSDHPYTSDLNVFGKHSLFQLVNRTVTLEGKKHLSEILKKPENKDTILERQEAIKELSAKLELRQEFEASGLHPHEKIPLEYLFIWMKEPLVLKNKSLLKVLSFVLPVLLFATIVGYFAFQYSAYFIWLLVGVNAILISKFSKGIAASIEKTDKISNVLKIYSSLLQILERENFESPLLQRLKLYIAAKETKASKSIKVLSSIVFNLELRKNPYFFMIINIPLLWDIQWMIRLEEWKDNIRDNVSNWIRAINEFEALSSLAGYHYAFPETLFPQILENEFYLNGTSVNHPLINASKRVDNGISINGLGQVIVITGSNMSGKSTYMRTIGVNSVLAVIGAPVMAASFSISPMEVFTCMHIHDSLEEETSSFYAELKRIKHLIDKLKTPTPVFFLLDELLKGTNSVDRNIGAKALIRQLHRKTASGLISTHDLEIGSIEEELPGVVKNYSFNSTIVKDEIIFDYKIKEGICYSFNASKLMEKMGIEIEQV